jgi:serine/threonine protein kinase/formylglycine-generating enzyme required for sulfatase activity
VVAPLPAVGTVNDPAGALDFLASDDQGALGRLGPYRVLQLMGHGGMGMVFLAEDPALHRQVALKVMLPAYAQKAVAKERFLREARATAQIEHDHIVTIFHVGEDRGVPYLAMQLLKGRSLEDRLREPNRLTLRQSLRIGREIALGLAAAHERGLIHRDIKPANIWLEDRGQTGPGQARGETPRGRTATPVPRPLSLVRVKILDFGLARAANDDTHITQEGTILGTPSYMSPEQAFGRDLDARSDLYSLGCVLYRLTTGVLPFAGKDTMGILIALASEVPKPVRELNADVPEALADLIQALLAKEPADRPASARAVMESLQAIERSIASRPPSTPTTALPPLEVKRPSRADIDVELVPIGTPVTRRADVELVALRRRPSRPSRPAGRRVASRVPAIVAGVVMGLALFAVSAVALVVHFADVGSTAEVTPIVVRPPLPPATLPAAVQPALAQAPFTAEQARKHQEAWARFLRRDAHDSNSLGMKFVLIPAGEFEIGSNDAAFQKYAQELKKVGKLSLPDYLLHRPAAEGPAHKVRITRPFFLGTCEVTIAQFRGFVIAEKYRTESERGGKGGTGMVEVEKTDKGPKGVQEKEVRRTEFTWEKPGLKAANDQQPVSNVTWHDAEEFCRWLSLRDKRTYRLPTEAEWEFACRAGTTTAWYSGDVLPKGSPGMWTTGSATGNAHPVGQWAANPFGLYDMHGNVAEMCADYFDPDYYAAPPPLEDPRGPLDRAHGRVVRGGGFHQWPMLARSAYRASGNHFPVGAPSCQIGFRVLCEIP